MADKKKLGRPIEGEPKNALLKLRIDKKTLSILDDVCDKKKVSRSELVRNMIRDLEK